MMKSTDLKNMFHREKYEDSRLSEDIFKGHLIASAYPTTCIVNDTCRAGLFMVDPARFNNFEPGAICMKL